MLTNISQKYYKNYSYIQHAYEQHLSAVIKRTKKDTEESYKKRLVDAYKKIKVFSIGEINEKLGNNETNGLEQYFSLMGEINDANTQKEDLFLQIINAYSFASELFKSDYPKDKKLSQDASSINSIKSLLDLLMSLYHFIKPLMIDDSISNKDERFYSELTYYYNELETIIPLYNKVRNYATQKAYSEEKIKLNFENSTLLNGWDVNKESDNTSVLLCRDGLYYLAIMNKKHNKLFKNYQANSSDDCYSKIEYKLLPGPNKMLPKVFLSEKGKSIYRPSVSLLDKYNRGTHKKGDNFSIEDCRALIDFFKESIEKHEDWKKFNFKFSDTQLYNDISDFYREIDSQGYKITTRNIDKDFIDKSVREGKLYLFKIYNKDFSKFSKGKPNLHTIYWKMLFDERNLKDVVYKLNGEAEVFYRKKSITPDQLIKHPANQYINKKNELNSGKSIFDYELIKDKRYTVDKFLFHVPITMNYKSNAREYINNEVNKYLSKNVNSTYVIGIDRGERHLLYLSLINPQGEIVEQYSLNQIINEYNNVKYVTDYKTLLLNKEEERKQARLEWKSINNIKELKEGYLSQVVHKISQLMIKYNAIVVLEDLNNGFKNSRVKFERQVYQKFEKQLIDKLNYLVDKNLDAEVEGGLLHTYQLTNKFESFEKVGKQSGFLFYIPAWNTSKIDPVTGFVNLFDTHYESIAKTKEFFSRFESIRYNKEKDYFEFTFDYSKFTTKADGTKTKWTVCTNGNRIRTFRNPEKNNQWDDKEICLTKEFIELFSEHELDYEQNIKQLISEYSETSKDFYVSFMSLFKLTLQMRNSSTKNENIDYLISPVSDVNGNFYNSDDEKNKNKNEDGQWVSTLPVDADANGAFNIARKGLWVLQQIEMNPIKPNLSISNKQWLNFVQKKNA